MIANVVAEVCETPGGVACSASETVKDRRRRQAGWWSKIRRLCRGLVVVGRRALLCFVALPPTDLAHGTTGSLASNQRPGRCEYQLLALIIDSSLCRRFFERIVLDGTFCLSAQQDLSAFKCATWEPMVSIILSEHMAPARREKGEARFRFSLTE